MFRKLLTAGVMAGLMLGTVPAFAASAGDGNDVTGGMDVRRSGVRIVDLDGGGRRVRLTVRTYDAFDLSNKGSFYWQLDTNGDGESDFDVYLWGEPEASGGPLFCWIKERGVKGHFDGAISQPADDASVCGFPLRYLGGARPQAWRLSSRFEGVIDRAPDTGWYAV